MNTKKPWNVLALIAALALLLPVLAGAYPAEVPRTGQTTCYIDNVTEIDCEGTGQDGDWLAGVPWPDPRFSERADGTVSDNLTGLVWAKNANLLGTDDADNDTDSTAGDGMVTWQHALDYIKKLNREVYLGHNDWRLPNVNELESLVNAELYDPALPLNYPFTNVQSGDYWSSTSFAGYTGDTWLVHIYDGTIYGFGYRTLYSYYVWPVRSGQCGSSGNSVICLPKTGQTSCYDTSGAAIAIDCAGTGQDGDIQAGVAWPSPRFVDNGETVTDNLTGLEWTKNANPAGGDMTWQAALDYVKTLNTGGHNDWRLPNSKELRSLADYAQSNPALPLNYPFTNVQNGYWSSTSRASYTGNAWVVDMIGVVNYDKAGNRYVWPVRSGQVGHSIITTTTTTAPITMAYPAEVARTGQTTCYDTAGTVIDCDGTGQDGDWLAGVPWPDPRFSERADGTVSDNLTGLVWAKNANLLGTVDADNDTDGTAGDGAVTWQHALDYIKKLNRATYLGHNDWRLPNVNELESLVNAELYDPALPLNYPFTNVQSGYYWSSTSIAYYTSYAWVVGMNDGFVILDYKTGYYSYVWPVRSGQCGSFDNSIICLPRTGQTSCSDSAGTVINCTGTGQDGDIHAGVEWPDPRFTDHGDNTTTDNLTGLVWAKNANLMVTRDPTFDADSTANDGRVTWQHALDYVAKLNSENYLTHNDWRLPNERELRSLADYALFNPALPSGHPFTNVQSFYYWSSTSGAGSTSLAWIVDMHYGFVNGGNKTGSYGYYVWPVRAGQVGNSIITTTTTTVGSTTTVPTTTTVVITTTSIISSTTTTIPVTTTAPATTTTSQPTTTTSQPTTTTTTQPTTTTSQPTTTTTQPSTSTTAASTTSTALTTTTTPATTTAPSTTTTIAGTTTTIIVPGASTTTTTVSAGPCPAKKALGENNPKLENLRDFRDSKLAQSAVGRRITQIYYNNADSINAALERSPALRAATRRVLEVVAPMVGRKE